VQTSNHKLTTHKETELYDQLVTLLADIEHPKAMATFLKTFLTDTERSVLSKRLAIFCLLEQGKSYEEIKDELHVSSATISSMAEQVKQPAITQALDIVKRDRKVHTILERLKL
jgi:Trp operon repressor